MIEGIPRISVYIITYNQENVIERTLASILNQQDYVYEICVSDDCSTDRTWEILNKYSQKYPGLFKLNRNEPNLGIFENTEKVWTMPTGDIVHDLAGDDCVGDGWFRTVVEFIKTNSIDYKNELFCIYGDFKALYPNGDSIVFSQNAIAKRPNDALRLALRGIIGGRSCCYSIKILKKFNKVSQGRSHIVETLQDRQLQIHSEKNYYIPFVGNVYNAGIGVSTHIQDDETFQERLNIFPYALKYLEENGIVLPKVDYNFCKFNIAKKRFRKKHSFLNLIKVCFYYITSYDRTLPHGNSFTHLLFALKRRFFHRKL